MRFDKLSRNIFEVILSFFKPLEQKDLATVSKRWSAARANLILKKFNIDDNDNIAIIAEHPVNAINIAFGLIRLHESQILEQNRIYLEKCPQYAEDFADALVHLHQSRHLVPGVAAFLTSVPRLDLWNTVYQLHKLLLDEVDASLKANWQINESRYYYFKYQYSDSRYYAEDISKKPDIKKDISESEQKYQEFLDRHPLKEAKNLRRKTFLELLTNWQKSYDQKEVSVELDYHAEFISFLQRSQNFFSQRSRLSYGVYYSKEDPHYSMCQYEWHTYFAEVTNKWYKKLYKSTFSEKSQQLQVLNTITEKFRHEKLTEQEIVFLKNHVTDLLPVDKVTLAHLSECDFKRERDGIPYGFLEQEICRHHIERLVDAVFAKEFEIFNVIVQPIEIQSFMQATTIINQTIQLFKQQIFNEVLRIEQIFLSGNLPDKKNQMQLFTQITQNIEKAYQDSLSTLYNAGCIHVDKNYRYSMTIFAVDFTRKLALEILENLKIVLESLMTDCKKEMAKGGFQALEKRWKSIYVAFYAQWKRFSINMPLRVKPEPAEKEELGEYVLKILSEGQRKIRLEYKHGMRKGEGRERLIDAFQGIGYGVKLEIYKPGWADNNDNQIKYLQIIDGWLSSHSQSVYKNLAAKAREDEEALAREEGSKYVVIKRILQQVEGSLALAEIARIAGFCDKKFMKLLNSEELKKIPHDNLKRIEAINLILAQNKNDLALKKMLSFIGKDSEAKIEDEKEFQSFLAHPKIQHMLRQKSLSEKIAIQAQEKYPLDSDLKESADAKQLTYLSAQRRNCKIYDEGEEKEDSLSSPIYTNNKYWSFKLPSLLETNNALFERLWKGSYYYGLHMGHIYSSFRINPFWFDKKKRMASTILGAAFSARSSNGADYILQMHNGSDLRDRLHIFGKFCSKGAQYITLEQKALRQQLDKFAMEIELAIAERELTLKQLAPKQTLTTPVGSGHEIKAELKGIGPVLESSSMAISVPSSPIRSKSLKPKNEVNEDSKQSVPAQITVIKDEHKKESFFSKFSFRVFSTVSKPVLPPSIADTTIPGSRPSDQLDDGKGVVQRERLILLDEEEDKAQNVEHKEKPKNQEHTVKASVSVPVMPVTPKIPAEDEKALPLTASSTPSPPVIASPYSKSDLESMVPPLKKTKESSVISSPQAAQLSSRSEEKDNKNENMDPSALTGMVTQIIDRLEANEEKTKSIDEKTKDIDTDVLRVLKGSSESLIAILGHELEQKAESKLHQAILDDEALFAYYSMIYVLLNGAYQACQNIFSGFGASGRTYNSDYVVNAFDAMKSIPGIGLAAQLVSVVIAGKNFKEKNYEVSRLGFFFVAAIMPEQFLRHFARLMTVGQNDIIKKIASSLPFGFKDKIKAGLNAMRDWIMADGSNNPIQVLARKNYETLLEAIFNGSLTDHPTYENMLNLFFSKDKTILLLKLAEEAVVSPSVASTSDSEQKKSAESGSLVSLSTPEVAKKGYVRYGVFKENPIEESKERKDQLSDLVDIQQKIKGLETQARIAIATAEAASSTAEEAKHKTKKLEDQLSPANSGGSQLLASISPVTGGGHLQVDVHQLPSRLQHLETLTAVNLEIHQSTVDEVASLKAEIEYLKRQQDKQSRCLVM